MGTLPISRVGLHLFKPWLAWSRTKPHMGRQRCKQLYPGVTRLLYVDPPPLDTCGNVDRPASAPPQPCSLVWPMAEPEPDKFVASLSAAEADDLRALAVADRATLTERLKAAGFAKLGQRMKVEARLLQASSSAASASVGPAPPASIPAPPPSVPAPHTSASEGRSVAPAGDTPSSSSLEQAGAPSGCCDTHAPPSTDGKGVDFVKASAFGGAMPGYYFSRGHLGVGYYRDVKFKPLDRSERVMLGNLSWLNEEDFQEPEEVKAAAAAKAAEEAMQKEAAAAALSEAERLANQKLPPSMARSLYVERKPAPFAPPLKEGKYADRGHMVKALDGRHAGKWGLVTDIKYHQFTVEFEDGNVEVRRPLPGTASGGGGGGGCAAATNAQVLRVTLPLLLPRTHRLACTSSRSRRRSSSPNTLR